MVKLEHRQNVIICFVMGDGAVFMIKSAKADREITIFSAACYLLQINRHKAIDGHSGSVVKQISGPGEYPASYRLIPGY